MSRTTGRREADLESRVETALKRCLNWSHEGRHRKVLAEVERMLGLTRGNDRLTAQLLIWKAQALLSMGCADRALPAASDSWELDASPHACHLMATALHAQGDPDQAEELLKMGRDLFRDAAHLPMQLAMMLADQGRLPEALDVLDDVSPSVQLPDDVHVFLVGLRANLLATVGRWSEAEDVLQEGLGRHPDSSLLHETHDTINRERSRQLAEQRLVSSWRESLEPLDAVAAEVDEAIVRCCSVIELPEIIALASRRLWRAFFTRTPVRLQSPDPWGVAAVVAVMEFDGHEPSTAAMARAVAVKPSTVRSALARIRGYLSGLDPGFARVAFGSYSNPRLEEHRSRSNRAPNNVIFFPNSR
jgi:tetratricopeptide (TPR) repeat protein